jgi:hypothetical protein
MAKSNSRGRAPTTSEFNDLWRKLLAVADKALDGDTDPDTGTRLPPTAATMEMCRKLISDAKLTPSHDVAEDARRVSQRLPFGSDEAEAI